MKSNKLNIVLLILILIASLIIVFLINKNGDLRVENNISEQNEKALKDSIRVTKNKVGDLEFSKNILISEKGDLKNLNEDLDKELAKEKGKVFELTKYVVKLKQEKDTVTVTNELVTYPEGVNGLKWEYKNTYDSENFREIAGISKFSIDSLGLIKPLDTEITKDIFQFNIIQGLREKGDNLEMFVRSDYPGFELRDLNSVLIDPNNHPAVKKFTKKKKYGISLYTGYGGTLIDNTVKIAPQVGVGLTYDLIQF